MNILFVSAVFPYPLHSGGQIRVYNLLKRVSRHHDITLVSFIRDENEKMHVPKLPFCRAVHTVMRGRAWQPKYYIKAITGKYPLLLATYDNPSMRKKLEQLLAKDRYDVLHIEPFYVLPSLPLDIPPLVVSEHNIEYDVYGGYVQRFPVPILRPVLAWDVMKLKSWERLAWRKAGEVTAVSTKDASTIEEYISHPVSVIPNGVDIGTYTFRKPVKRSHQTLLFVGNFRWHPNRDAAYMLVHKIWPLVKNRLPSSHIRIVGRDIPKDLSSTVLRLGGEVDEEVEDISQVYRDADILIAPHAIGGGTKFKILEAMATGLPIVTSKQGVGGLSLEANTHYLEANTPEEFAAKTHELWDNTALAQHIASHARRLVESRYSWDGIAGLLEKVWRTAYANK